MSLSIVSTNLSQWAAASALKAARANDPDSIAALQAAEARFLRLSRLLEAEMAELAGYRAAAAQKAAKKRAPATIGALEFWRRHGAAVQNIIAAYGLGWKVKAPFGETEIVTVPSGWRSCKTERGTVLKWSKDARVPSAQYWQDGRLPAGLIVSPDYPRDSDAGVAALRGQWKVDRAGLWDTLRLRRACPEDGMGDGASDQGYFGGSAHAFYTATANRAIGRLREVRQKLRDAGTTPWASSIPAAHDAAWHKARGYVWHKGEWVSEMWVRSQRNQTDQIEVNRAAWAEAKRIRDNARASAAQTSHTVMDRLMSAHLKAREWANRNDDIEEAVDAAEAEDAQVDAEVPLADAAW